MTIIIIIVIIALLTLIGWSMLKYLEGDKRKTQNAQYNACNPTPSIIDHKAPQVVKTSKGYTVRKYNHYFRHYEFLSINCITISNFWWTAEYLDKHCIGTEQQCKDALYDYLVTQGKN